MSVDPISFQFAHNAAVPIAIEPAADMSVSLTYKSVSADEPTSRMSAPVSLNAVSTLTSTETICEFAGITTVVSVAAPSVA